jgi:hypothetical protein
MEDLLKNQDFPKPEGWKNEATVRSKIAAFRRN